jgi:hypothetical protein
MVTSEVEWYTINEHSMLSGVVMSEPAGRAGVRRDAHVNTDPQRRAVDYDTEEDSHLRICSRQVAQLSPR